jgi:hypothetical protein
MKAEILSWSCARQMSNGVIERLRRSTGPDRQMDEAVARALGFRIAATTRGPHIMREGSVASWDLPAYTATPESRAEAINKLSR